MFVNKIYMDNKYLMLDDSENFHMLFIFSDKINIKELEESVSNYKKEKNQEWFYEDIEYLIKSKYPTERVMIFENGLNCNQLLTL